MADLREPAVAGRFYPADPAALSREVRGYLAASTGTPVDAHLVVAPHAGYMYSGAIAGETYAQVNVPRRTIVLCPNHTGLGSRRSVWADGIWSLPGGGVPVDASLADDLIREAGLRVDPMAHLYEHAIEVHLPFLRERQANLAFVPICLSGLSLDECYEVGEGVARVIGAAAHEDPVLLVASTDMSHYVSAQEAERLDRMALEKLEALDPNGLYRVVQDRRISMCGYIPVTVGLIAALRLGASRAKLVRYGNSGQTSGDFDRVVGYAGLLVS